MLALGSGMYDEEDDFMERLMDKIKDTEDEKP